MKFSCPDSHPHNKFQTCYRTHGCRCLPCTTREARRKAKERARIRSGTHQGMVDKARVVGHIQQLEQFGMTRRDIARCAGLNEATVHRLAAGKGQKVFPQTAKAILTVRPETKAWRTPKAWVNSTGTIRRIQALMAIGYAGSHISKAIGHSEGWAALTLRNNPSRVEESSRVAVAELFSRWAMTRPEGFYADRTRAHAARKGYAPPLAWDDIDDIASEPDMDGSNGEQVDFIEAAILGERPDLTPEERREVIAFLNERHWSAARIAEHIDCNPRTVDRIRKELNLPIYLAGGERNQEKAA